MHWSVALPLAVGAYATRSWVGPAAFLLVVVAHAVGHALVRRWCGGQPEGIWVHALGGHAGMKGDLSAWQDCAIAWGGVMGQAVLFAAASLAARFAPGPLPPDLGTFLAALALWNLFIAFANLIPTESLDGGRAWRILPLAWAGLARRLTRALRRGRDRD
ncbi:MAG: M50 family metallopeptidase [Anaeromyxobacter sp.]